MRVSDKKHPLLLSVHEDSQFPLDETDFNRIDHRHVQRSNKEMEGVKTNTNSNDLHVEPRLEKRFVDKDKNNIVSKHNNNNAKNTNNDVDYEYDDPWLIWKDMVKSRQITPPDDNDAVNMILEAMMYKPVIAAGTGYRGTQLKATLTLEGKQRVVFKPKR